MGVLAGEEEPRTRLRFSGGGLMEGFWVRFLRRDDGRGGGMRVGEKSESEEDMASASLCICALSDLEDLSDRQGRSHDDVC